MIKNKQIGSDITIMNTIYRKPQKKSDGKWESSNIDIIYKDNTTGKKHVENIKDPTYQFYVVKDEYIDINNTNIYMKAAHNLLLPNMPPLSRDTFEDVKYNIYLEKEYLNMIEVKYNLLDREIAKSTNMEEFYITNKELRSNYNKVLHMNPNIMNSDSHIEDHYRERFSKLYQNNICSISKAYLDIEVDVKDIRGDFPDPGEAPINASTIVFSDLNKVYCFILRDKTNPQIDEFEELVKSNNMTDYMKNIIFDAVGGWKQAHRFNIQNYTYEFLFYDEEIQLIADMFQSINSYTPDFVLAWNMSFDIPYIIARIEQLGYDPSDIITHQDFKHKTCRYYIDERNRNEFTERGDFATISSYTVFIDQMIQFASRRKGQSAFTSFSLDYVGGLITNVKKYDYKHITSNIALLPTMNFRIFIIYNIMDTIVQNCIENKTNDIEYLFSKCNINNTRYNKAHRQTIYLTNRAVTEFEKSGIIIGNNNNRLNVKDSKFPGAFIADPNRVSDIPKAKINNIPVNVFYNSIDLDFSSLYPSILRENNMAPHTQYGKILMEKIWENENIKHDPTYSRGGEYIENLQSGNYIIFANRWLKYPTIKELLDYISFYYTNIKRPFSLPNICNFDGTINPAVVYDKNLTKSIIPANIIRDNNIIPGTLLDRNKIEYEEIIYESTNTLQHYEYYNRTSETTEE